MKRNLLKTFFQKVSIIPFAIAILCTDSGIAQVNGDLRNRPNTSGGSISATIWEAYDSTTGLWTASANQPTGNVLNLFIRDGVTQSWNSSSGLTGNLTIGEGNAATATATIDGSGTVTGITITNSGQLTVIPAVQILGPCTTAATGTVNNVSVTGYEITNPGSNYTTATVKIGNVWSANTAYTANTQVNSNGNLYTCTMSGTSDLTSGPSGTGDAITDGSVVWKYTGTAATGTATIGTVTLGSTTYTNGIVSLTIVSGTGYTSLPTITITGDGSNATAIAKIGVNSINITSAGSGYATAPAVILGSCFLLGNQSNSARSITVSGNLEFKMGATSLSGGPSQSAALTNTFNLGGNLIAASPINFYWKSGPTYTAITRVFFTGTPTISGNGPIYFANMSVPASKTLTLNNSTIYLTQATPVTLGTGSNIDASNGTVGYLTYSLGAVAQTIANNTFANNTVKNLIINNTSGVTTTGDLTVSGTLTQQAGIFTIPATKTLRVSSGNAIAGSFSSTSYINTASDAAAGTVGIVQIDDISTARTLPLGNNSTYLPVTITPASTSTFTANVFKGATDNGTANGIATSDKTNLVDAIYTINRTAGSGSAQLTLGFPSALKGSGFTSNNFGISHYNGSTWDAVTGSGDNTANTATATFNVFSPFRVEFSQTTLGISLTSFSARADFNTAKISWITSSEINNEKFILEKSTNGINYTAITEVKAKGPSSYSVTDYNPANGTNYYRLIQYDLDGKATSFGPKAVDFSLTKNTAFLVYPNPVNEYISFNLDGTLGNTEVVLTDLKGRIIHNESINSIGSGKYTLTFKQKPAPGQYVLRVINNGQHKSTSVIIL